MKRRRENISEMERSGDIRIEKLDNNSDSVDAHNPQNIEPKPTVQLPTTRDSVEYNMTHKNRGKCIIFNNKIFQPYLMLAERHGTDLDAQKLSWRFRTLGFKVEIFHNLSVSEMENKLREIGKDDYTDDDCLALCVLSHGEMGVIYGADGPLSVESIFSHFTADVCPTLAGKPRLFFIQACKGIKKDDGLPVVHQVTDCPKSPFKIPIHADFLMAFSTVPEFVSWRCELQGAWFIQSLCSALQDHGDKLDILSIMTHVNRLVAIEYESSVLDDPGMHGKKQMSSFCSTLTRKVYFRPKNNPGTLLEVVSGTIFGSSGTREFEQRRPETTREFEQRRPAETTRSVDYMNVDERRLVSPNAIYNDENAAFVQYVSVTLGKFPPYLLALCKKDIFDVLHKTEMGELKRTRKSK